VRQTNYSYISHTSSIVIHLVVSGRDIQAQQHTAIHVQIPDGAPYRGEKELPTIQTQDDGLSPGAFSACTEHMDAPRTCAYSPPIHFAAHTPLRFQHTVTAPTRHIHTQAFLLFWHTYDLGEAGSSASPVRDFLFISVSPRPRPFCGSSKRHCAYVRYL